MLLMDRNAGNRLLPVVSYIETVNENTRQLLKALCILPITIYLEFDNRDADKSMIDQLDSLVNKINTRLMTENKNNPNPISFQDLFSFITVQKLSKTTKPAHSASKYYLNIRIDLRPKLLTLVYGYRETCTDAILALICLLNSRLQNNDRIDILPHDFLPERSYLERFAELGAILRDPPAEFGQFYLLDHLYITRVLTTHQEIYTEEEIERLEECRKMEPEDYDSESDSSEDSTFKQVTTWPVDLADLPPVIVVGNSVQWTDLLCKEIDASRSLKVFEKYSHQTLGADYTYEFLQFKTRARAHNRQITTDLMGFPISELKDAAGVDEFLPAWVLMLIYRFAVVFPNLVSTGVIKNGWLSSGRFLSPGDCGLDYTALDEKELAFQKKEEGFVLKTLCRLGLVSAYHNGCTWNNFDVPSDALVTSLIDMSLPVAYENTAFGMVTREALMRRNRHWDGNLNKVMNVIIREISRSDEGLTQSSLSQYLRQEGIKLANQTRSLLDWLSLAGFLESPGIKYNRNIGYKWYRATTRFNSWLDKKDPKA